MMKYNDVIADLEIIANNVALYSNLFMIFFDHFTDEQTVNIKERFRYKMVLLPHQTGSFIPVNVFSNCELLVQDDDNNYVPWIQSGPSLIPGGGTGLFASRVFDKRDIITIYLGRKLNDGEPTTYACNDITAANIKGGLSIPYLLAHFINHAGNKTPNCELIGYKIVALRKIRKNEEFLFCYNRDVFCGYCATQMDHSNTTFCENEQECNYMNCTDKKLYATCSDIQCLYKLCKLHYFNAMID
jgi:hypothetical protein